MWPGIPPSRPPSGLHRPTRRSSGVRSRSPNPASGGLGSMGGHYADSDDDDDSSCDDTYVSMSSARGSEKGRILKETSRVSNKPRPSSSSTLKSSKHKYDKYGESSSSTAGILEKLKNDINSLERLRQATATDFSDSSFERGEAYNRSHSSMRSAGNT